MSKFNRVVSVPRREFEGRVEAPDAPLTLPSNAGLEALTSIETYAGSGSPKTGDPIALLLKGAKSLARATEKSKTAESGTGAPITLGMPTVEFARGQNRLDTAVHPLPLREISHLESPGGKLISMDPQLRPEPEISNDRWFAVSAQLIDSSRQFGENPISLMLHEGGRVLVLGTAREKKQFQEFLNTKVPPQERDAIAFVTLPDPKSDRYSRWTRDYLGPISSLDGRLVMVDPKYFPDAVNFAGSKHPVRVADDGLTRHLADAASTDRLHLNLVLQGGNLTQIGTDSLVVTQLVFSENPSKSPDQVLAELKRIGRQDLIVIPSAWSPNHSDQLVGEVGSTVFVPQVPLGTIKGMPFYETIPAQVRAELDERARKLDEVANIMGSKGFVVERLPLHANELATQKRPMPPNSSTPILPDGSRLNSHRADSPVSPVNWIKIPKEDGSYTMVVPWPVYTDVDEFTRERIPNPYSADKDKQWQAEIVEKLTRAGASKVHFLPINYSHAHGQIHCVTRELPDSVVKALMASEKGESLVARQNSPGLAAQIFRKWW